MVDIEEDDDPFADKPPPKTVWQAAEEESLSEVIATIADKQDINAPNPLTLNTPLMVALKINSIEMANLILSRGADVKPSNTVGDTALHWAALRGEEEMVKTMISRGANINAVGEFGNTPLHFACGVNHVKIVCILLLVRRGASVMVRNEYGNTPYLMSTDPDIRQLVRAVIIGKEAGREQVRADVQRRLEMEREAEERERRRQQAIEDMKRQQEEYDQSRREEILAEEKRIEEEDAERERQEAEERRLQEEARLEAERLEAERIKAEKKAKKYEKWLAKMKKKNPSFVDPRIIKAQKAAAKAAAKEKAKAAKEKAKAAKAKKKKITYTASQPNYP